LSYGGQLSYGGLLPGQDSRAFYQFADFAGTFERKVVVALFGSRTMLKSGVDTDCEFHKYCRVDRCGDLGGIGPAHFSR